MRWSNLPSQVHKSFLTEVYHCPGQTFAIEMAICLRLSGIQQLVRLRKSLHASEPKRIVVDQ